MISILVRVVAVVAVIGTIGLVMWAPWRAAPEEPAVADAAGAQGAPVDDGTGYAPHELIRYDIPEPKTVPPIEAGATDLTWSDLWLDGEFKLDATDDARIGNPTAAEFPDGTSAEDIRLFFLDIGDMRDMQLREGAVRQDLDGKRVRIAGYTTPVGFAEDETRFLLVPELGACIHVPPPPPNQIVYVEKSAGNPEMFAAVWVTGTLKAVPVATVLADVGYQLVDVVAEPYR